MNERRGWNGLRDGVLASPEAHEAYDAARIRFELGHAVRERREALGMTQAQLAHATGMRQTSVARFEAGGTMPTLPLLERLAVPPGLRFPLRFAPPVPPGLGTA